jgi:hypothetical protein
MSDTPTFASLLTRWSGGGPAAREAVYAHLRADPAAAAALEASMRDELNSALPSNRVIAAEADAAGVLRKLSPPRASPLLAELALHATAVFRDMPEAFHRWAGETAARAGAGGADVWLTLLARAGRQAESALLMGLADAAGEADCDLSACEEPVRVRLFHETVGYAAGAALWRLTWRVNREWLATIHPRSPIFERDPALLAFVIEVLVEHLGRRPDLAKLVRELLIQLGNDHPDSLPAVVRRVANAGGHGWSVVLPLLGDPAVAARTRAAVFRLAAESPPVLPLAHHYAHAVVLTRELARDAVPAELLQAAADVLGALGPAAGSALPDVRTLIFRQPDTARVPRSPPTCRPAGWARRGRWTGTASTSASATTPRAACCSSR